MLCEVCGRNQAERKLNKYTGGNLRVLNVCRECFNRGGELPPAVERKCPYCGRTLTQITQTLIVGCPKCYEFFNRDLDPLIRQVQQIE